MKIKAGKILLILVVCFMFVTIFACGAFAETRYIAQKYSFTANGSLNTALSADFGSGNKNLLVEKKELSNDKNILLVAMAIDDEDVFALQLFDSKDYSIYKLKLRDDMREEVVILGLGPVAGKRVQLRELYIIAEDDDGEIRAMQAKGFTPKNVLNSPLQLDKARSIVLPTQVGEKTLVISWSKAEQSFVVDGGLSASVKKDDGVFDEE